LNSAEWGWNKTSPQPTKATMLRILYGWVEMV
jgi:hypothetical protein